jgi:cyclophilin family peptidyl-prolyl cis-trans isomerase
MLAKISAALALVVFAALPALAQTQNPRVDVKTSAGSFVIELYPEKAPKTVANFLQYAKEGFYKGTVFHRVIDGFMIQGGGFDREMRQKPTHGPVPNEAANRLRNDVGTLAMARTSDPHSATAQFFVNLKDNDFLNFREPTPQGYGYTVFGRVVEGMDVVQRIAKVKTSNAGPHQNVPQQAVVIEAVSVKAAK